MSDKKILVVDDEEHICELLKDVFSKAGYSVFAAQNGTEAMEIFKQENISTIFLDLKMQGMDGLELCNQMRIDNPIACIHAVTGNASVYDLFECRAVGFDDFFTKPIFLNQLLQAAKVSFEKLARWEKELV